MNGASYYCVLYMGRNLFVFYVLYREEEIFVCAEERKFFLTCCVYRVQLYVQYINVVAGM